jgi:hypothetical protein
VLVRVAHQHHAQRLDPFGQVQDAADRLDDARQGVDPDPDRAQLQRDRGDQDILGGGAAILDPRICLVRIYDVLMTHKLINVILFI